MLAYLLTFFRHIAIDHLITARGIIRKDRRTLVQNDGSRSCDVVCQDQTAIVLITGAPCQLEGKYFNRKQSAVTLHVILVCVRFQSGVDKVFILLSINMKVKT